MLQAINFIVFLYDIVLYFIIGSRLENSEKLTKTFNRMGPIFIKFGQIVAARTGVFSSNIDDAFMNLRENNYTIKTKLIRSHFKNSMGISIDSVFDKFSDEPIASGSLAQVYSAYLKGTNQKVAVKIIKPDIRRRLFFDLFFLRMMIFVMKYRTKRKLIMDSMYKFYLQSIYQELDMRNEAINYRSCSKHSSVVLPILYNRFTTQNTIVYEFLGGEAINHNIHNKDDFCNNIVKMFVKDVFYNGYYHADLHTGNIRALNGQVILFDFGIMGTINKDYCNLLYLLTCLLLHRKFYLALKLMQNMGLMQDNIDINIAKNEMQGVVDSFMHGELSHQHVLQTVSKFMNTYGYDLTYDIFLINKNVIYLEDIVNNIYNDRSKFPQIFKLHILKLVSQPCFFIQFAPNITKSFISFIMK